jgi:glycosyltransferase involved in cell wall biosynthesis
MPRRDLVIYMPHSAGFYSCSYGRAGGAERQMTLLARTLAARGLDVAHIVYPVADVVPGLESRLTLVHRNPYSGDRGLRGRLREAVSVLRALRAADAQVVVVRTGTPVVGLAALYCRLRRRRLIFSSAIDADFLPDKHAGRLVERPLYRLGVQFANAIVVQTDDQLVQAKMTFPRLREIHMIPSFAEAPADLPASDDAQHFIWIGRLVEYKQPLLVARLAEAMPEAQFVMVPSLGEHPSPSESEYLTALQDAARRLPNLDVQRSMPHAQLVDEIARAVAVVNTSYHEGMPNVFLEAWSRGVPVLTLGFDPDRVVERRQLGIAAGFTWDRFVAGARELWEGRSARDELAQRVRAYIQETHSPEAVGARWQQLVKRLAPGRAAEVRSETAASR